MEIRKAKLEDLDNLKKLTYDFLNNEKENFEDSYDPSYALTEASSNFIKGRIEAEKGLVLVAEDEGKLIGFLIGFIGKIPDARKTMKPAVLDEIFIEKEYRRQKIGREMLAEFQKWAKRQGANKLRVSASTKNNAALQAYKNFGFSDFTLKLEKDI